MTGQKEYYYSVLANFGITGVEASDRMRQAIRKLMISGPGVGIFTGDFDFDKAIFDLKTEYRKQKTDSDRYRFLMRIFGAEDCTMGKIFVEQSQPEKEELHRLCCALSKPLPVAPMSATDEMINAKFLVIESIKSKVAIVEKCSSDNFFIKTFHSLYPQIYGKRESYTIGSTMGPDIEVTGIRVEGKESIFRKENLVKFNSDWRSPTDQELKTLTTARSAHNPIYGAEAGRNLRKILIKLSDLPTEADYNKPKSRSLNPTVEDLERRFNRTGQTPADLFPKGWDLSQYLDLVTDKKKMYLHFSRYGNHKNPRNEKDY